MADKVLEEIFQKVSRMSLETDARTRLVIVKGWENEWARFCPSFAALQARQREAQAARKATAEATAKEAPAKEAPAPAKVQPVPPVKVEPVPPAKVEPVPSEGTEPVPSE
jgi:hypothetical protein